MIPKINVGIINKCSAGLYTALVKGTVGPDSRVVLSDRPWYRHSLFHGFKMFTFSHEFLKEFQAAGNKTHSNRKFLCVTAYIWTEVEL